MARSQEPAARVKLLDALAALNPKSEYLAQAPTYYFTSYRQMNQNEKALAVATKAAESQTADEDMLLFFSRRIGLSPDGRALPIPAGVRLTAHVTMRTASRR